MLYISVKLAAILHIQNMSVSSLRNQLSLQIFVDFLKLSKQMCLTPTILLPTQSLFILHLILYDDILTAIFNISQKT